MTRQSHPFRSARNAGADQPAPPVPAGAPTWVTPELIGATLDCWQSHYHEALTPEDALEILLNTAHLLDLLEEDA
ncbi:MAG: hypothetical protein ACOC9P_03045 [bacterium]